MALFIGCHIGYLRYGGHSHACEFLLPSSTGSGNSHRQKKHSKIELFAMTFHDFFRLRGDIYDFARLFKVWRCQYFRLREMALVFAATLFDTARLYFGFCGLASTFSCLARFFPLLRRLCNDPSRLRTTFSVSGIFFLLAR